MRPSLFLDDPNPNAIKLGELEKLAGLLTPLPQDPSVWPQAITTEAFKQVPFLSGYDVDVSIERQDPDLGMGFGGIIVRSQTHMTESEALMDQTPMALIPVIIRDWKMAPLDIFGFRGRYQPLTEIRLKRALFRPQMFDAVRTRPPDRSIWNQFQPPAAGQGSKTAALSMDVRESLPRKDFAMSKSTAEKHGVGIEGSAKGAYPINDRKQARAALGLVGMHGSPEEKAMVRTKVKAKYPDMVSDDAGEKLSVDQLVPLLPQLNGRVRAEHVERIKHAFIDPTLRARVMGNDGLQAAFASAMRLEPSDHTKTAEAMVRSVPPTVVQIKNAGDKLMMKWANVGAFMPMEEQLPPDAAQEVLGNQDMVQRLETDGSVTMSPDAAVKHTLEAEEISNVDRFGEWVVQESTGATLIGFCFPQVLSFDLQPLPLIVFSNGSQFAIQDAVAGKLVATSTEIPRALPRGFGCFYYIDHGTAKAFEPMTVVSQYRDEASGIICYVGKLYTGGDVTLHLTSGLKTVARIGPTDYAMPDDLKWMPMKGQTELVSDPHLFVKVAMNSIGEIFGSHDGTYTLRGPVFEKLATYYRSGVSRLDAEFLLVAAGVHESFVKEALDRSSKQDGFVRLGGLTPVIPISERMKTARSAALSSFEKVASANIKNFDLIKEAALLDDSMTADKVLGLGLISPDNVQTFVNMLPSMEATVSRLSDMLLASRLGMQHVREDALERILVGMDDVIEGLQRLRSTGHESDAVI